MEPDLQITVKGISEEKAYNIGHAVAEVIKALKEVNESLDLRRLHRIILTMDFAGELTELSTQKASGNRIKFTDEDYAVAIGKFLLLPKDDEFEIVIVMNGGILGVLAPERQEEFDKKAVRTVIHFLHHELCHVHDENKKIDAYPSLMLKAIYTGKDSIIRPMAEACWSEYIANFMSSKSAPKNVLEEAVKSLMDAIKRTKPLMDEKILQYRYHGDLEHLMDVFGRHGEFLIKAAAYVLGYIDGLGISIAELNPQIDIKISDSYFDNTWNAMQRALQEMRRRYPDDWKGLEIYDSLSSVIENYYIEMGLLLSTTNDGRLYINIPFSPETTPPEVINE